MAMILKRLNLESLRRMAPSRSTLKQDAIAGLTGAIGSVPDGMASGVLAGVNPIYGLYASMVGPIVGGAFASTRLLLVTTTSAAAIATGQALSGVSDEERVWSLFLLSLLIGAVQIAAGLLRLGSLTRFVSHSVMTGFLTGIAVLIVLGQLGDFTGYAPEGANKITQTFDLLLHLRQVHLPTIAIGTLTLVLAAWLPQTRLGSLGTLVALLIPLAFVTLVGGDGITLVGDSGEIPRGLPLPALPRLGELSLNLATSAAAIAVVILVQGAGVSQSVPNRDGTPSSPSRDFIAQGAANIASGLFRGLPVGGSVGQTALNANAGAQSRWAAIMSGVWMALILLLFTGLVARVPMPALAALLILAGYKTIKVDEALSIWRTGWVPRITITTTFTATLFLPIQAAVGIGAALSAILYVNRLSVDIRLVEWVILPDGRTEERRPPPVLPDDKVTVLDVYGSLFYAGAWTLARGLPSPRGTHSPVVVLRLRGRAIIGATFIDILADYAAQLRAVDGRLYLSGVDTHVREQFARTGKVDVTGPVGVYLASDILGESTRHALADAETWLIDQGNLAHKVS